MDAGKIATIELNMDSKEKKDKKQREPGKLKSFLQKYVETLAAKLILADKVRDGDTILIELTDGELTASAKPATA